MPRSRVTVAMRSAAVLMTTIAPAYGGKALPIEDSKRVALSKTTTLEADRHLWLVRGKLMSCSSPPAARQS